MIPTRRNFLLTAATAAGARALFGKAAQPATALSFDIPPGACDCHTHIFGDPAKFPFWSGRTYTPDTALPEEMTELHRRLHIARVVIVTPSVYATDNSAMLSGLKARGKTARGVAMIDDKTADAELDALAKAGVRGIRIALTSTREVDPAYCRPLIQAAFERLQKRNWHLQLFTNLAVIAAIQDLVEKAPVPVVFDHFGGALAAKGIDQPGFSGLETLVRSGKAYVKISGAYRASTLAPDYPDVAPLAKTLIAANPDRVIWGTDWPHPDSASVPGRKPTDWAPLLPIDDGRILNLLPLWAPDAAVRKKILVDNPARLYGF
jgi:predicted TIM-barrel fold metal-dependent hydrolase